LEYKVKVTDMFNSILFSIGDEKQRPIAIAILHMKNHQIGDLIVDSKYRNKGFGSKLLKEIENYAENHNIPYLTSVTHKDNIAARELFKKMGYKEWIKVEKWLE